MKEFWKSVNIWWSYDKKLGGVFFWLTVYSVHCEYIDTNTAILSLLLKSLI